MKTHLKLIFSMLAIASMAFVVACGDDDDDPIVIDKAALATAITTANTLQSGAVEGTANGQYLRGSKEVLQTAIDLAQQVADSEIVTQIQVDNAVIALNQAVTEFEGKEVVPIEPTALIGHWTFDEGQGTAINDFSGNSNDGTLQAGHPFWGAGTADWVTDRYGNTAKALHFDEGANVEIPYSTALNPTEMTISLWLKGDVVDPIWANNYMVSMNRWNGYKLQLQSVNKVFLTVKADVEGADDPAFYDRDNESPTLNQDEWYHATVTFGGGEMVFYINGVEVKRWDNTPGTAISIADVGVNLTIGQDLPTGQYTEIEGDDFYVNWGGYFIGALDEVRMFNKVLSATQVSSIYELEKP